MEIAEIFRQNIPQYLKQYSKHIPFNHIKVINDILSCRTANLGGKVYYCENCQEYHYSYHSCKNRHCPKCGSQDSEKWLKKQQAKLLPTPYFMVTFTIPEELRKVCRSNQRLFYSAMFKAASASLRTLLKDPKFAGGESGFTGILHTWTRQLQYHPHIHFIVPGGGFDFERNVWNKTNHKFLVPVKALSQLYRKNFEHMIKKKAFGLYSQISYNLWRGKEFISNSIPVGKGEKAFIYLANYVYKTAITNNRIISHKNGKVTFKYKDSQTNRIKFCTISAKEFIRRFLQHVLPSGFQKIRYYGFYSSASKRKWQIIADYFKLKKEIIKPENKFPKNEMKVFCRHCSSKMIQQASILRKPRAPPDKLIHYLIKS